MKPRLLLIASAFPGPGSEDRAEGGDELLQPPFSLSLQVVRVGRGGRTRALRGTRR